MTNSDDEPGTAYIMAEATTHVISRRDTGEAYRIDIAVPPGSAPTEGWPSVFLLDASGCFATCVEAVRRMARRPDATGVAPMLVVGISSTETGYDVARRRRDFTSPKAEAVQGEGGAAAFLNFLLNEVKLLAARIAPMDSARVTLFGHSLAGYFTLWTLIHHPASFAAYAAISPSVWWDKPGLLDGIAGLEADGVRGLICLGEWEDELPPWQQVAPGASIARARRQGRDMIGSARDVAERLAAHPGVASMRFSILPEEDHASIVSAAIPKMLRLASGADFGGDKPVISGQG